MFGVPIRTLLLQPVSQGMIGAETLSAKMQSLSKVILIYLRYTVYVPLKVPRIPFKGLRAHVRGPYFEPSEPKG